MSRVNWLDRLVGYISPTAGVSRIRARIAQRAYNDFEKRRYEGASKGRRTEGWRATGSSANSEIGPALSTLRNRSRDLARNNPYAHRAIKTIVSNVVGTGIVTQPRGTDLRQVEKLEALWKAWALTRACDAEGRRDIYGLQALIAETLATSGECLVRRRRRYSDDPLPVPLQVQVLEPDFIDTAKEGATPNGGYIIQGVEFDPLGRRSAYWLFDQHPGDQTLGLGRNLTSRRVPADQIEHLFEAERPGQVRGVPRGASVYLRLRDFDEYEDFQLVKQKVGACFAGFIVDSEPPTDAADAKDKFDRSIEPGMMETLPPGKDIRFPSPPQIQNYGEYASSILHAVAAGYGVTYEAMTGDYSQVNYSSGRMGWLEFNRTVQSWQWLILVPGFCEPVWNWFVEAAEIIGESAEGITPEFTPPAREMIDPTREVPALREAVRSGFKTLSGAIREQGNDPRRQLLEWKQDAEMLDKFGLKLDCDPRVMNRGGSVQVVPNDNGGKDEEQDDQAS